MGEEERKGQGYLRERKENIKGHLELGMGYSVECTTVTEESVV